MKPHSVPGGSRQRGRSPSPIPVGSPKRNRNSAAASLADPARPKPRRLLGLASRPKPLRSPFRKTLGRSLPVSRGTSRGVKPLEIPLGSWRRPKALPLSRKPAFQGRSLFDGPPSGRGWRRSPSPSPCRLEPRSDSRGLCRVGGPSGSKEPLGIAMGSFVKSRLASAFAYAGAASSASLPSASERQRPWGSDGAFGLGVAAFVSDDPFPVRRLSGHVPKLSALPDSGKANPPVDNEDNGGKSNLDQPLPPLSLCGAPAGFGSAASQASRVRRAISIAILRSESPS